MSQNKIKDGKIQHTQRIIDPNEKPKYEDVTSIQAAINKCVATGEVVRFICTKSNKQIKAEIESLRGCMIRKPGKDSTDVAIIPPGREDFSFDEVDTTIVTYTPSGSKTPGGIIVP